MRQREEDDPADEEQHLPRQLRRLVREHRLQERDVTRQAARQLPGAPLGEEAGGEPHQMGEQVLAQPRDDPLGG
jgi:hypothetical protein